MPLYRLLLPAALCGLFMTGPAAQARSLARPPPVAPVAPLTLAPAFTELAPGAWVYQGAGGAVLLAAGEDGAVLVDTDLPKATPDLLAALDARTRLPLRYAVNTHWHLDHVGANQALSERGAVVVAHENARARMAADTYLKHHDRVMPARPAAALPGLTLAGDGRIRLRGLELRLIHVPRAHTDGDLLAFLPDANVLHLGDCYFNGLYPIIDTGTGGTVDGLIAALDVGLGLADERTRIVAGHGPVGGKADLKAARDMLAEVRARVARLKAAGQTREQVLAAAPTADLDPRWGQGWVKPAQIVGSVYDSLP